MNTWADILFNFYTHLHPPALPAGVSWLYPQKQKEVQTVLKKFLEKYYSDDGERTLLLGINPGRFGAGITGVNFTAPKQLRENCHIENPFKGSELSAEFIYEMINAYGGVEKFYGNYFIGSVCPLGLVEHGKNLNYYDNRELLKTIQPFITENLSQLIAYKINNEQCVCIGGEKNFKYLSSLNEKFNWFKRIVTVPHPRFIMQYKRKYMHDYINLYLELLHRK
jgi:hypothetical protein